MAISSFLALLSDARREPECQQLRVSLSLAGVRHRSDFSSSPPPSYDEERGTGTRAKSAQKPIFTIGHSTRPIEEFTALLHSNGIERVIDIRTIPKSRRNPQFNGDSLAHSLQDAAIDYIHLKELGGLRHPMRGSTNTGWRNDSFRGYADYMQTMEFESALEQAIELAKEKSTALMCAEAVPWRCHRSLVADALIVRGIEVLEIVSASAPKAHKLTPFAVVRGERIIYPSEQTGDLFEGRQETAPRRATKRSASR